VPSEWAVPDNVQRLIATVPSRPAGDLDDAALLAKARETSLWNLTVTSRQWLAPRMLRLTVSAPGIDTITYLPGQDFTMCVMRNGGRDIRRRYTIAGRDADAVHLDVSIHGDGVGTAWALARQRGDVVSAIGPRGKFVLDPTADWLILVGDETSLPGILAMLAATDAPAQVAAEVDDPRSGSISVALIGPRLGGHGYLGPHRRNTPPYWSRIFMVGAVRTYPERRTGCWHGVPHFKISALTRRLWRTRPTGASGAPTPRMGSRCNDAASRNRVWRRRRGPPC
jgi:hypothetical protein